MALPLRLPPALLPLAALLALYLAAPFAAGLAQLGQADWRGTDGRALLGAATVSVGSASLATLLVAAGGVPLGYLLARRPGRLASLAGFLVQLPLALPPLASGILLLFLLGYASPLGRLSGGALTDSFAGIVLAEAFVAAPFLVIAARSAFAAVDPVLEDVAATLGHRPGAVFRRVSLAGAAPGIWAGLLLTWLRAFGEFGATVMVAYHPFSLPVYTYVAFGGEGLPAMLPILLPTLAAATGVMALSLWAGKRPRRAPAPTATAPLPDPPPAPPLAPPSTPAPTLFFAFQRRRPGFTLDVRWETRARRLCILGASGSGKSAILRQIAGLDPADSARLTLAGRDLASLPAHARGIAYLPQTYGLLPHLPLDQQVRFGVGCNRDGPAHWTRRLGLDGLEARRPAELSPGQQQRAALARALSRPNGLLLLDEPFSALDAPLRRRLRAELLVLQREIGTTTILVTHDPAEAMLLADDLLLLQDGQVLRSGPVEAVFRRPGSAAAALLLGAVNIGAGQATGPGTMDIGGVHLQVDGPDLPGGELGWAVRPDSVQLGGSGHPACILAAAAPRGGRRRIDLRLGQALLQAWCDPGTPCTPGPCRVTIDPAAIQVWPRSGRSPTTPTSAMQRPARGDTLPA